MNEPINTPVSAPPAAGGTDNNRIMAIASLVIGIINLCAWFFPICGAPLAIVGMVLSGIGLLLACVNGIAGVLLGPQIQDIFNSINQSLGY